MGIYLTAARWLGLAICRCIAGAPWCVDGFLCWPRLGKFGPHLDVEPVRLKNGNSSIPPTVVLGPSVRPPARFLAHQYPQGPPAEPGPYGFCPATQTLPRFRDP